jgi:hypothetical protein
MMKFFGLLLLSLSFATFPDSPAMAQSATPQAGGACSQVGTFAGNYNSGAGDDGTLMVCSGTVWVPFITFNADKTTSAQGEFRVGVSTGLACDADAKGFARYDTAEECVQTCNGTAWACVGGGEVVIPLISGADEPVIANSLDDLLDVNVSGVADAECLVYDSASSIWGSGACGAGGGSTTSIELVAGANTPSLTNDIDDLLDVSISGPSNSQCLVYDSGSSTWQNGTCNAGATTAIETVTGAATPTFSNSLNDLSDVEAASPSTNDVLLWDGSDWIAQSGITSDRNLKSDIAALPDSEITKIYELSAQSFRMNSDPERLHFGFIAQDVQTLYPYLVNANEKGNLSLDYIGLIGPMVEAIKDLRAENEALTIRIQALEEKQP